MDLRYAVKRRAANRYLSDSKKSVYCCPARSMSHGRTLALAGPHCLRPQKGCKDCAMDRDCARAAAKPQLVHEMPEGTAVATGQPADNARGTFFESRFKSIAIIDEEALLTTSVYPASQTCFRAFSGTLTHRTPSRKHFNSSRSRTSIASQIQAGSRFRHAIWASRPSVTASCSKRKADVWNRVGIVRTRVRAGLTDRSRQTRRAARFGGFLPSGLGPAVVL